jgi:predicted RNA-binding Zn-ribbon protein involved in translation (DUF1610 family)
MPACTTAAAAGSTEQQQQASSSASLWWASSSSSSSRGVGSDYSNSSLLGDAGPSNQQWLQALQIAGAVAAGSKHLGGVPVCDSCGSSISQQDGMQQYSCPGCGVARYCSSSCAAEDRSQHEAHCRCEVLGCLPSLWLASNADLTSWWGGGCNLKWIEGTAIGLLT